MYKRNRDSRFNIEYAPIATSDDHDEYIVSLDVYDSKEVANLLDYFTPDRGEVFEYDVNPGSREDGGLMKVKFTDYYEMLDFLYIWKPGYIKTFNKNVDEERRINIHM